MRWIVLRRSTTRPVSNRCFTPATVMTKTLVVCNVNRHVGVGLLLSGAYFRNQKALPAIAAYALAAQLMIWLYAKLATYREIAT